MNTSKTDIYVEIAKRTGLTREQAKKRAHMYMYGNHPVIHEAPHDDTPIALMLFIEACAAHINTENMEVSHASNTIGPDTSDIGGSSSSVSSSSSDSFSDYSSSGGSSSDW